MSLKNGYSAEELAASYLAKSGYKIIDRNVRYPFGELDIVAEKDKTLVFVEVKHRKDRRFYEPYETVTAHKQKKIIKAATAYLQKKAKIPLVRFDVIALCGPLEQVTIDHIADAFMVEGPWLPL